MPDLLMIEDLERSIAWNLKNHNRSRNPEFKTRCLEAIAARNVQLLAVVFTDVAEDWA